MDDPYRSSQQTGTCPRCHEATSSDGELDRLAARAGHGLAMGRLLCPICQKSMSVGFRDEVRFDYCGAHGVWLDAGEFERFAQVFRIS